jgi:hypothetical protein
MLWRTPVAAYIFSVKEAMRVTLSLPQWGRQPKGSIPLTPFLHFSRL